MTRGASGLHRLRGPVDLIWAAHEAWAGATGPLLPLGPGVASQSPCLLHVLAVMFLEVAVEWGLHGRPLAEARTSVFSHGVFPHVYDTYGTG